MYCRECGKKIDYLAEVCVHCGAYTEEEPNAFVKMLTPIGRSGYAIAAGYLGLLSFFGVLAPLAIVYGIIAIIDISKNSHKHGMGRAIFGIEMGFIFTYLYIVMIWYYLDTR